MSYILDALKKSDQERQQSNGPTLQTIQHSRAGQTNSSGVSWPIAVVLILLVILLAVASWYFLSINNEMNSLKKSLPLTSDTISSDKNIVTTSTESTDTGLTEPTAITADSNATAALTSKPPIVELWELPDTVQKQLPAMTFSFHVYSDNPTRRTIIINNRRVKQGETVVPGLLLEEITPQGIIFDWQSDFRFSINVVENW